MSDSDTALRFKGRWRGRWELSNFSGDFALVITEVEGANVEGEAFWYGTASITPNERLLNAAVSEGVLSAEHPSGIKLRLELTGDDAIAGSWKFSSYRGELVAQRDT